MLEFFIRVIVFIFFAAAFACGTLAVIARTNAYLAKWNRIAEAEHYISRRNKGIRGEETESCEQSEEKSITDQKK